ncbi:hypothetical protein G7Y89_g30 [Cudoniella acicularis]|uniref:NADPH-dependent diflavin oxidoreductase 1 n=1 Tax=Cudoniella acicularis TaxID=354080 RepID=A0A8H4WAT8_9HELO|nr:hypothetical protein G7Y89_g30 [Cudoniella acicularis]
MAEGVRGQRHDRSALILYGSETGNSQDVAEELGRTAERLHFVTRVSEMDLVEINLLLKHRIVIVAISTTGQGEFPKNARKFWTSLLRKRLPPGCLDHVKFTTFGLGDSSYPKYNWAARKLHKRLEQLGAQEFYPRGEADEQHDDGVDGTFLSWSADLRKHLLALFPLPEGLTPIPSDVLLPPKYILELEEGEGETKSDPKLNSLEGEGTIAHGEKAPTGAAVTVTDPNKARNQIEHSTSTSTSTANSISISISTAQHLLVTTNLTSSSASAAIEGDSNSKMYPTSLEPEICQQLDGDFTDLPELVDSSPAEGYTLPIPDCFEVQLIENKRITSKDHWQDVRQLTFIMPSDTTYDPGDLMTIYPKNFDEDVQALLDLMDWSDVADRSVHFTPTHPDYFAAENLMPKPKNLYTPVRFTLRQLLTHNLDITAIPKRHFFEIMAHYADDPVHKQRLYEFSNPTYTDEFYDYTSRPRRSILEVLQDFPSVKFPWKLATTIFPVMRGRQYSISSGGVLKRHPNTSVIKVQLLVALVKYKTVLKKVRKGLCSRYIASLPPGTKLHVTFEAGSFYHIARDRIKYPVVLIGPGTGLAPLRSLIWERAFAFSLNPNSGIGDAVLFYGGRNKNADYFYREEWALPTLRVKAFTAFSRDQEKKIYVQDIIRQQGKLVANLISRKAMIFVCGSSGNMPKAVREAIIDAMAQFGGFANRDQAAEELASMEKRNQYVQETW